MSAPQAWMVLVGLVVIGYLVFLAVVVARGQQRYREGLDSLETTTGQSVQLVRSKVGRVYEVIEFYDQAGRRVVGRPAPPSQTRTDRQGQAVTVRYRPDLRQFFVTEPFSSRSAALQYFTIMLMLLYLPPVLVVVGTQSGRSGVLCNALNWKDASSRAPSVDFASRGLGVRVPSPPPRSEALPAPRGGPLS